MMSSPANTLANNFTIVYNNVDHICSKIAESLFNKNDQPFINVKFNEPGTIYSSFSSYWFTS